MYTTEGPRFSVTWPNYQNKISNGYIAFQQHEDFVDMTLAADGHYVKVHQFIVALASSYLKEVLKSLPARHPVIFLNNVSYNNLCHILEYIYTGEVKVPQHQLDDFLKSARALKLEGISNATVAMESNGTLHATSVYQETPQPDTAENMDLYISDELEQRISLAKNLPEVDEIIRLNLVNNAGSSVNEQNIQMDTAPINPNSEIYAPEETNTEKNYDNTEVRNIVDQSDQADYCIESSMNDQSIEQNRSSPIPATVTSAEEPSTRIHSGTISTIGQKTIKLKVGADLLRSERKRKPGPTSLQQSKVKKLSTDDMGSIVIETNVDGHLSVHNSSTTSSETTFEAYGKMPPPLKYGPIKTNVASCYSETSMPQLILATGSDSQIAQKQDSLSSFTINNDSYTDAQANYTITLPTSLLTVTSQTPQIILAPNVPPIITETEYEVVPSTSVQKALDTQEFHDLIDNDLEERAALGKQLKEGAAQVYTISNRGSLQMILNRFIYYVHYSAFGGRKRRWRCIDYRRMHCLAYLDTDADVIAKRVNKHTHSFHDDKILDKVQNNLVFSTIKDATVGAKEKSLACATESSDQIE